MMPPVKLFISYRRKTWPFTHRLAEHIQKYTDWDIFVDYEGVDEADFECSILHHLRESDCFLLIISEHTFDPTRIYREEDWVRREIREALTAGRQIVLAMVEGLDLPPADDLPHDIREVRKRQGINFYPDYFDAGVVRLVRFIAKVIGAQVTLPSAHAPLQPSPAEAVTIAAPMWLRLHGFEPEMIYIPPGPFMMGSAGDDWLAYDDERPQHELDIPYGYWIGKYPVMVSEYRAFIAAGGYRKPAYWTADGWRWCDRKRVPAPNRWDDPVWTRDRLPVVGVSWYEAMAYCKWLSEATGRRVVLPSEAEWEKAARGGLELPDGHSNTAPTRRWLWGDEKPDAARCNFDKGVGHTTPVDTYGLEGGSPYGCIDMAGNAWEWTRSVWGKSGKNPDYQYPYRPNDGREDEDAPGWRVMRGGSWDYASKYTRVSCRGRSTPSDRYLNTGFRVAGFLSPPSP